MKPSVLLVDDHGIVREGLASLLAIAGIFDRIAVATDGAHGVELARELAPKLIVTDLLMPGLSGADAICRMTSASPTSHIVVLTSSEDEQLAFAALKAGARSFLIKSMSGDDILDALRRIVGGAEVIHPSVSTAIMKMSLRKDAEKDPFACLTPREIEVLGELAKGASNSRIAGALNVTERTVKSHIGNILSKLNLADRTEAVAFAWRNGLIVK